MTDSSPAETASSTGWRCVACGAESRREFEVHGYWVRTCVDCGHQFAEVSPDPTHVDKVYGDDYFVGGGAGYSDYLAESRLLVARGRWYGRLGKRFVRVESGRAPEAFDIGAAAGFTMLGLHAESWSVAGLEPNASMAAHAREKAGLDVVAVSLEDWSPAQPYDLITALQVLPHFVDPKAALGKIATALAPGGVAIVETWDRASWTARWSGRGWHEYSPPSVLHWFSRQGLHDLAGKVGLELVGQGRPSKWIDVGHAKSLLSHKLKPGLTRTLILGAASVLPNRLALPYPAEDLFWAAYRKP